MECFVKVVVLNQGEFCMGPGFFKLLSLIQSTNSVSSASKLMGLSYSKAWKMIGQAEDGYKAKLVQSFSGGNAGGQSMLTGEAQALMDKYRKLQKEVEEQANRSMEKIFC